MKVATMEGLLMNLRCLDGRFEGDILLNKKKMVVGSGESCDIRLNDRSVSSYHAFILVKDEGIMIKDLYSEGGVFVNGNRVEESYVAPGDVVTIGTLSFSVLAQEGTTPVINADEGRTVAEVLRSVELPPREGLIFIDGEYCDIKFDDSKFEPRTTLPEFGFKGEYVDLDISQEPLDIVHQVKDKRLEIITYMNGLMMDIAYLPLKDGVYFLDGKKGKKNIPFYSVGKTKIFEIKDGQLRFVPNEAVTPSMPWEKITMQDALFLTHGTEQISLRFVDQSVGWKGIPLFWRDREMMKQGAKVFAGMFLPLLVLLFVNIDKPQDIKEEVAVIYKLPEQMKKAIESQEKSDLKAEELTSKTENTGHKENEQQPNKVEFAAASQTQKVVAKNTAPAPAAATPTQTTPVKAYEFKSSVAMGSLVADAPKINAQGTGRNANKDTTFNSGSADDGALVAGADIGVSKFNGSDKKGSGSASYGSRGLASKSGFDSAYLEPKTVVLGSMDPELLRKILREYIPQFRHCYQQELIGNSDKIKGVIDLNFTISAAGKVSKYNIRVKDAKFSEKGVGCMGQVLSLIDFPKPKGGGVVDVKQPLNFFAETEKI